MKMAAWELANAQTVSMATRHYLIRDLFQEQMVFFCYSGYVTEALLGSMGQAIRQKLEQDRADLATTNTVFSIFVELMQNVIRYSVDRLPESAPDAQVLSHGTLTMGRDVEGYFVASGNKVAIERVARLREHLERIRQMDRTGLKVLYRQILRGEIPEGSKGAGVGFVDIAKRASRPIEFDFVPLDDRYAFFVLKAVI